MDNANLSVGFIKKEESQDSFEEEDPVFLLGPIKEEKPLDISSEEPEAASSLGLEKQGHYTEMMGVVQNREIDEIKWPDVKPKIMYDFSANKSSENKPHVCVQCERGFTKSSDLVRHMRSHTGERPYVCEECGKGFTKGGNLVVHMRIHTGERPHVCKQCGKGFTKGSDLMRHLRSHTGERPHVCEECGKGFTKSSDLMRHMRTHTGERPYACEQCGKEFTQRGNLVKHMRSHHPGEDPMSANICGKGSRENTVTH